MKTVEDFTVAVSRLRQVYQRRGRWRGSLCCPARPLSASTSPAQQISQIDAHFFCNTEHHTSTILFIDAWSTRAVHVRRCTGFWKYKKKCLTHKCTFAFLWIRKFNSGKLWIRVDLWNQANGVAARDDRSLFDNPCSTSHVHMCARTTCCFTGMQGGKLKRLKASSMNSKPTPCIAVYVNFNFVSQFVSLLKADTTSRHKVLVQKHPTGASL